MDALISMQGMNDLCMILESLLLSLNGTLPGCIFDTAPEHL